VNVSKNYKSKPVAVILGFLFGPFGLLYLSITEALICLGICTILSLLTYGFFVLFIPIVCAIWAGISSSSFNKKIDMNLN